MKVTEFFFPQTDQHSAAIPFFSCRVPAGFPSPADDYCEKRLDLTELCIANPPATFLVRASGQSMIEHGINDGDVLVVDRSISERHNRVVIAIVDGEFLVKKLDLSDRSKPVLRVGNPRFTDIHLAEGQELEVFGVVTWSLHKML